MKQPLHERIRSDYEGRILSGALLPGARLPTEQELMRHYDCSRMTVNKALSALSAAGLIDRRKRAGTFVARPRVHSMVLDVPDLEQEVVQRGQAYRYALLRREVRLPDPENAEEALLAGAGQLLVLEGVHHADGVPLATEQRLISLSAVPDTGSVDFEDASPGAWLLKHVPWTQAETRIAAVAADRDTAHALTVAPGAPCLLIERRTWRGDEGITLVRQQFVGSAYDLIATFGPAKAPSGA